MDINKITRQFFIAFLASLLCITGFAQGQTVSGKVTDSSGEPLIGVNVTIPGTTTGVTTNIDGNYSLSVPADSRLQYSFIGYVTQTVNVGAQSTIDIILVEQSLDIDEVVVVGYGTMKKADLTGSVSSIDPESLVKKGTSTMMESLQGQVPGVAITQNSSRAGGGFDIQIRGNQSIGNSSGPLYVVDGIVVSDIQMLNPADIERVDILKDASSTAIYGSRASEGVVLVTTKSAKEQGGKARKPTISYDAYVGSRQVAHMPNFMNGHEFMSFRFARYTDKVGRLGLGLLPRTDGNVNYQMRPANLRTALLTNYTPEVDGDGNYMVGPDHWDHYYPDGTGMSRVEQMMANGETNDWPGLVTQNAIQQNHFLSVSGATENSNYYFGVGYQQDQGIFLKDDEKRFNIKSAIDTKINDVWNAGMSLNLARTTNEWGSDTGVENAFWSNPYFIPKDEEGNYLLQSGNTSALNTANGDQFSSLINPLIDMDNTTSGAQKLHILGNVYLSVSPIKNLTLKTTLSPNVYQGREHLYQGVETDDRNSTGTDYAEVISTNMFDWTWDNQVNYSITAGDHSIKAMGLFSMNKYSRERFTQSGEDFPAATTFYNMGTAGSVLGSESEYTEYSLMSYAARLNYSFRGKYMFTGTVRTDGSSRFAADYRWGTFPSAAVAWRASEEDFMKYDWLDNLKIRLSFGMSGNNNVGNYATATMPSSTAYYAFASDFAYGYGPNGIVNAGILWEKTSEVDLGFDLSILKNRINIIADVYSKVSDGLLMERSLAVEAGGGATVDDNIGKVSNKGFELSLHTVNVSNRNWRWETSFNFSRNVNAIEELYGGTVEQDLGNAWFVGEPVNVHYDYSLDGVITDKPITVTLPKDIENADLVNGEKFSGSKGDVVTFDHEYEYYYAVYGWYHGSSKVKDLNEDGIINDEDKSIIGKTDPDWIGSINTTLTYKNWDLSASLYTKQNYMVNSPFYEKYYTRYGDRGRQHINFDYYIPAGTPILLDDGTVGVQEETYYGSNPYPTANSSIPNTGAGEYFGLANTELMSFVKIKNISLGYTVPKNALDYIGISYLRVYANVLNPFVFTNYRGFDPEWAGSDLDQGGPSTITYQFGINLKF
ncbi:MAG: TonB-dependent receptor [Prolixibacteraceae bacterium]|jgi:TonB-linked SusC/RagA family outer membrane protein|nr:TonB-dependent receptor [Prolixibacteraceae bacterium]